VARKTGYPANLIHLDLDVEAELGLDSIKQVEIVRELTRELGLDLGSDTRSSGYQITTLRDLIQRIEAAAPPRLPVPVEPSPLEPAAAILEPQPEFRTDCSRLVSSMVEAPLPESGDAGRLRGKRVALLSGGVVLSAAVARRLEAAGAVVTDSSREADFVVSLSGCENSGLPSLSECAGWWAGLSAEAASLLGAARECAPEAGAQQRAIRWVAVSTLGGEFAAKGVPAWAPQAGLGLAIGRCLSAESGGRVRGLYLDFEPSMEAQSIAAAVCAEMARDWDHREIGYRNGKRFAIRWIAGAQPDAVRLSLNETSVVLAIGGARGITAAVCEALARRSGARFILAGQTPLPPPTSGSPAALEFNVARQQALSKALAEHRQPSPADVDREAWQAVWAAERAVNIEVLREFAAQVDYRQCDLLDPVSVRELVAYVAARYGKIDLVLQGSGALSQKAIQHFPAREFVDAMAPKALGTAHLLAALDGLEVDTFLNLSSISGRWGNAGQAAYAAGHEVAAILTASAAAVRGGRWFNVYFGPWLSIGMTDRGAIMERLRERGLAFIRREDGAQFTADEVERGSGESVAYCGSGLETMLDAAPATAAAAPLLDRIEIPEVGVAHGQREFDPARDRSIADHQVAEGLPVVPGLLMLEMMAQAGAVLVDRAWQLTEIAEAQFVRAAKFPQGQPRTFHVRARLLRGEAEGSVLSGEVYTLFTPPGSQREQELLHARCRLHFGHREPAPLPTLVVPRSGLGHAVVDASPLWTTKAFGARRGLWTNIGQVHSVTAEGTVGQSGGAPLTEAGPARCLSNIVGLDGGMLMGALSTALYIGINAYYVTGMRSIRLFASGAAGSGYLCLVQTGIHKAEDVGSMEALDQNGRVAVRLLRATRQRVIGAEQQAAIDEPIWNLLREHPRQARIRELLGIAQPFALAQVDIPPLAAALEQDAAAVVHDFLSAPEQAQFQTFAHPKRRQEWLAGRIAAKSAVGILQGLGAPDPSAVRIVTGEEGRPGVALDGAGMAISPFVSIAHSGALAAALATLQPGFGIDVEGISGSASEVESEFAGPDETALVYGAVAVRDAALTCLWATKEACRKAMGAAGIAPRDLILRALERSGEYLVCVLDHPVAGSIRAVTFHDADYAFAVAGPVAEVRP
jgi:NAD(P)-dependent dehydrogenase (short-subunit alcohol dehydrogenase family)/phosphopantetheinyl transferase